MERVSERDRGRYRWWEGEIEGEEEERGKKST